MDRGEFQQDSVLKQLEVLKEEEKEFQNLKVSISPPHPQPHDRMRLKAPQSPLWHITKMSAPQGAGYPSPYPPQGRTSSSLTQQCCSQAFCPRAMSPTLKGHPCRGKDALVPTVLFAGPSVF